MKRQRVPERTKDTEMSLRAFHLLFISLSVILAAFSARLQQGNESLSCAGQPAFARKTGLPQQTSLVNRTVDLTHFISNHLLSMPVVKIVIHDDLPSFCLNKS